ncbi:LysR family transcriptional regulator [Pseudonocardia acaciae]|uniref:LysR family transcriptional regulator n=1 Tax=Pseudonocardia acaciae TaxID=551276 RepID=UPI000688C297|nr:LysR family transcriptional regulator [Pseudonocardia acaciae]
MLDPRRLAVLREVAARGSLAKAARALSFTPSAVSQQIAALEREAKVRLLTRTPRGVRLTDAGRVLVRRAEAIASELARAQAALDALATHGGGTLRLGVFPSVARRLLPGAVERFMTDHALVDIGVVEQPVERSMHELRLGELDLALGYEYSLVPGPELAAELQTRTLFSEAMCLVMPVGRATVDGHRVELADLADERWLAAGAGTSCREAVARACHNAGFQPRVLSACNDLELLVSLVAVGMGVALVPAIAARHLGSRVDVRPLPEGGERRVFVAWGPGGGDNPNVHAFVELLAELGAPPA